MFFGGWPEGEYAQEDFLRYGTRLYAGFAKCARTMIDCGNRLIVDTVAWNPGSLDAFVEALWDTRVLAVGVHCPLEFLKRANGSAKTDQLDWRAGRLSARISARSMTLSWIHPAPR